MSVVEFSAWPKTPRLFRDIVVTEKIDGTNACVIVTDNGEVHAQSRTRLITASDDNFGFAAWVESNKDALAAKLGEGHHFGEWWGRGVQRGYGLDTRIFSMFNVTRWAGEYESLNEIPGLRLVPVLYQGVFDECAIRYAVTKLRQSGSVASPAWLKPEGVVVFHTASRQVYKVLLENDEIPKGAAG